jgi:hypothetical protein
MHLDQRPAESRRVLPYRSDPADPALDKEFKVICALRRALFCSASPRAYPYIVTFLS